MVLLRCTADPQNTVSGLKKRISAVSLKPKVETNTSFLVLHPFSGADTVKTIGSYLKGKFPRTTNSTVICHNLRAKCLSKSQQWSICLTMSPHTSVEFPYNIFSPELDLLFKVSDNLASLP